MKIHRLKSSYDNVISVVDDYQWDQTTAIPMSCSSYWNGL